MLQASEALVERAKEIAADLLEANPADIVLDTGTGEFSVAGTPAAARSRSGSKLTSRRRGRRSPLVSTCPWSRSTGTPAR